MRRDASLATNRCLHRFYQENDLLITRWTVNVFDYILLAMINIKPEFWPFAMSEECAESSHSSTSLIRIDLFFLYIASSNPEDPVMRALLELSVMNVEKEMSMVKEGKKEGKATARMVTFVESMMRTGRCSKSPTFGKLVERTNNSSCRY